MRYFLMISTFLIGLLVSGPVLANPATGAGTSARQAMVIDFDTGMVLLDKNADEKMPTSSMSKVMTVYMVFEALKDERIALDDKFKVSEKAWRKGGSKMFVEVGDKVSVEDLLRGVIVQSGNDATIVLAEGLNGSEDSFAAAMTARARDMGMENSNFVNASGWPDPDHYSTAHDLAILGLRLIKDFPEHYHYFAEKEFSYNDINQRNRNPLLFRDIGADGIKTGHTEDGGYGLMASGKFGGRRVVMVVNGLEDEKARAQESARLLEWALKGFQNVNLFKKGEIVDYANVIMGKAEQVPMVIDRHLNVTVPINLRNDLRVSVSYEEPLMAPIREGTQVGTLHVEIPRVTTLAIPLYAGQNVEPLGFFAHTVEKAKLFLSGGAIAN